MLHSLQAGGLLCSSGRYGTGYVSQLVENRPQENSEREGLPHKISHQFMSELPGFLQTEKGGIFGKPQHIYRPFRNIT